ncbi:MAG TPA: response regulator [Bacteroidales bacterium]|nr:response regulator [Bacteroidales bacterium]HPR57453.1 response regulator [Bacteroidales bacterium]HRW96334.1 response regulator [Bacteroidales bacterium]
MKPLKILVVEDEVIVATDIEETLLSLDYQVQKTVATGKAAIEEVERSLPDIILMDIMLKGQMTGIEAARIICQKHNVPIIYLTANADLATIEKAKVSLPYGYIVKPFTDKDLQTNIEIARFKFENDLKHKMESDQFNKFFKMDDSSENELIVESESGLEKVKTENIYYVEQSGGKCIVHLLDEELQIGLTIKEVESQLDEKKFLKVNSDCIINLDKIFIQKLPEIIIADKMTVIIVDENKFERLQALSNK